MPSLIRKLNLITATVILFGLSSIGINAQSAHSNRGTNIEGEILSVTAWRTDTKTEPIRLEDIFLYENGVEQRLKSFSFDPSPSRIVLLVDNSQTMAADMEKMKAAVMEFAYEIYDGDQLYVIAYDESPEIIHEWSDDAVKMELSLKSLRKKGNPHLFDALNAASREVLLPLMPGSRKTAIVIIGDGLDRGSKTGFEEIIQTLQTANITVYSLQLPDRTGGAYRRNQPKAGIAITQLTESTGGRAFPFAEANQAAKSICDELRKNRYLLSYLPVNTSTYDSRRLFMIANEGISLRTKNAQPPNIK